MSRTPGIYRLCVGPKFYIGSTTALGRRLSQHRGLLEKNEHPNRALQAEWNERQSIECCLIKEIPRKLDDTDRDHRKRLQFHEQLELDEHFASPDCLNESETSGFNAKVGDNLRLKWQDPAWRKAQIKRIKEHARRPASTQTIEKMSAAKQGDRNPNARSCALRFQGKKYRFATASEAAIHFGTTQQAMQAWLAGTTPWPGSGKRGPRPHLRKLIGLKGKYE